jgi:hypothetical protein
MKKLGIIQSRGIGDIIIALPIAKWFSERGFHVYWPIDESFFPSFSSVVDYVNFIPFKFTHTMDGFLAAPMRMLNEQGCDPIIPLYSFLSGANLPRRDLFGSQKFDEYKYAISGVPFCEKWNLSLKRNLERENALFQKIIKTEKYVVEHLTGSNCHFDNPFNFDPSVQVVKITPETENIFDWIKILENAESLVMVDSCFSNLVEQLGITKQKVFILRSDVRFTPVLLSNWKFIGNKTI